MTDPILEMVGIAKDFEGVHALSNVDFTVEQGEILALVGENGAGKSTLMKIVSGVYPHGEYRGEMRYKGALLHLSHTRDAQNQGIAIIHQELNLVAGMTVAENIFLGNEPSRFGWIDRSTMRREARELLDRLGLKFSPDTLVSDLSVGQSQMTEIAKALAQKVELLILDEPTSALTDPEIDTLFGLLEQLKQRGVTSIYISHKLEEVFRIADRITVLRDGSVVASWPVVDADPGRVVSAMVGRDIEDLFPWSERPHGETVLSVRGLTIEDPSHHRPILEGIDFDLHRGEILGLSGLMGSGRTELAEALFGVPRGEASGRVEVSGKAVRLKRPQDAIEAGIALLTEDRKQTGCLFNLSIRKNISLASMKKVSSGPWVRSAAERELTERYARELGIKSPNLRNLIGTLSGGNQQKALVARWLATDPKVLILDEPTRGVDVGAKVEIYRLMIELAREGMAILMISSELPEILGMSDRILVMREGRIVGELSREEADQEKIMHLATGMAGAAAAA